MHHKTHTACARRGARTVDRRGAGRRAPLTISVLISALAPLSFPPNAMGGNPEKEEEIEQLSKPADSPAAHTSSAPLHWRLREVRGGLNRDWGLLDPEPEGETTPSPRGNLTSDPLPEAKRQRHAGRSLPSLSDVAERRDDAQPLPRYLSVQQPAADDPALNAIAHDHGLFSTLQSLIATPSTSGSSPSEPDTADAAHVSPQTPPAARPHQVSTPSSTHTTKTHGQLPKTFDALIREAERSTRHLAMPYSPAALPNTTNDEQRIDAHVKYAMAREHHMFAKLGQLLSPPPQPPTLTQEQLAYQAKRRAELQERIDRILASNNILDPDASPPDAEASIRATVAAQRPTIEVTTSASGPDDAGPGPALTGAGPFGPNRGADGPDDDADDAGVADNSPLPAQAPPYVEPSMVNDQQTHAMDSVDNGAGGAAGALNGRILGSLGALAAAHGNQERWLVYGAALTTAYVVATETSMGGYIAQGASDAWSRARGLWDSPLAPSVNSPATGGIKDTTPQDTPSAAESDGAPQSIEPLESQAQAQDNAPDPSMSPSTHIRLAESRHLSQFLDQGNDTCPAGPSDAPSPNASQNPSPPSPPSMPPGHDDISPSEDDGSLPEDGSEAGSEPDPDAGAGTTSDQAGQPNQQAYPHVTENLKPSENEEDPDTSKDLAEQSEPVPPSEETEQTAQYEAEPTHASLLANEPPVASRPVVVYPQAGTYVSNAWAANTMFQMTLLGRSEAARVGSLGGQSNGAWAMYAGSRGRLRDDSGKLATQGDKKSVLMGFDLMTRNTPGGQFKAGLFGGYGHYYGLTRSSDVAYTSRGRVDGHGVGAYAAYVNNPASHHGLYLDNWVLWNRFDNRVRGGDAISDRYHSKGFTASTELGWRIKLAERNNVSFMLQPRAQLIYQNVRAPGTHGTDGTPVEIDNDSRWQTLIAVRAAARVHTGYAIAVTPHVEASFWHTTKGYRVRMEDATTQMNSGRNIAQLKLGVQGQLTRNLSVDLGAFHMIGQRGFKETGGNIVATYRY